MPSAERRPVPSREEVIAVVQAWRRENDPQMGPNANYPDCGYCVESLAVNVGLMEENRQLKKQLADGYTLPAPASPEPGGGDPARAARERIHAAASAISAAIMREPALYQHGDDPPSYMACERIAGAALAAAPSVSAGCDGGCDSSTPDVPAGGDGLVEEAADELYAAGPFGEPSQFVNDGAHLITDAHTMEVYRDMARMVLAAAARLSSPKEGGGDGR